MRGISFIWKMAKHRKISCSLVLLFTAAVTVFMLAYPNLIQNTRNNLEKAYDSLSVEGWMSNAVDYTDPNIPNADWQTLLDSGLISQHVSYSSFHGKIFPKEKLQEKMGQDISGDQNVWALQQLLGEDKGYYFEKIRAYNSISACDDLVRLKDGIQWLHGYTEDCLTSAEHICLLPKSFGYLPGDIVPILIDQGEEKSPSLEDSAGIIRLKVAGVYAGKIPEFGCVLPLKAAQQLCDDATKVLLETGRDAKWDFTLNGFRFTVKDNRELLKVKELLGKMGYDGSGEHNIKAVIDDRILQGTVSPIKSNLALLEGLYLMFFAMIVILSFCLSFLLAKNRKAEYAVMRMLGESRLQITLKVLTEQTLLCLSGILLGGIFSAVFHIGKINLFICISILFCYVVGTAAAILLTIRGDVMEILQNKE